MLFPVVADHFSYSRVLNVPRACNSSAHEIAGIGMSWDSGRSTVWTYPLLESVNVTVARDLAELALFNTRP